MIIEKYTQLVQVYQDLGPSDIFMGRIPKSPTKQAMLLDLTVRGVRLLPSATAQMLNDSKVSQALFLGHWMLPHTTVITRRKTLLDTLGTYRKLGVSAAVTKQDHLHCGHGVRQWQDLETLYSVMSLDDRYLPFVLQPFARIVTDLRTVVVGDYREAYARSNPNGFRMNLAAGGTSQPYALTDGINHLCDQIMQRGQMPFAHIDLIVTEGEGIFLSEVSLGGGLRGAQIDKTQLDRLKRDHLKGLAAQT